MSLRQNPMPTDKDLAALRANALKSTGLRTELGRLRVTGSMRRPTPLRINCTKPLCPLGSALVVPKVKKTSTPPKPECPMESWD